MSLELRLSGIAIEPRVTLSPDLEEKDGICVLNLGHTISEDTVTRTLQLHNNSPLGVRFEVELESLLPKSLRKERPHTFSES